MICNSTQNESLYLVNKSFFWETMKKPSVGGSSFLVFWTWESQVTSDNAESYSYCSLIVPPRNEIAVAPQEFEMEECGHQLQKRPKMTTFWSKFYFRFCTTARKALQRSKVTFPHQLVALFPMVKSKTRSKIHQVPAILKKRGFLIDPLLNFPHFHIYVLKGIIWRCLPQTASKKPYRSVLMTFFLKKAKIDTCAL